MRNLDKSPGVPECRVIDKGFVLVVQLIIEREPHLMIFGPDTRHSFLQVFDALQFLVDVRILFVELLLEYADKAVKSVLTQSANLYRKERANKKEPCHHGCNG